MAKSLNIGTELISQASILSDMNLFIFANNYYTIDSKLTRRINV